MRLIRPLAMAQRPWSLAVALGVLLVGCTSLLLMGLVPDGAGGGAAALGIAAALALGVGGGLLYRALRERQRAIENADLARLLAPAFDDSYVLIVAPRLPGVPNDLAGVLVGPPGVRALIVRRWRGRYRIRGRRWEYDTRSRTGWIPCRTNPSFAADAVTDAVAAWARVSVDESMLPIAPAVVFPRAWSDIVLEEPDGEIVTADNAPWWAQRIGRIQRMDASRVTRFVEAVMDAGEGQAAPARAAVDTGP